VKEEDVMNKIKAPFNFIPVSEKVFYPEWHNQISHDIPFSDSQSGVIEFNIIAESPIFIRNGHTKDEATSENDSYKSFSKAGEKFLIPATTIKGAVRNVLEIMSFGKMNKVDDDSFGVRDLNDLGYRNLMKNQHCGWLQYTPSGYMLTDCGMPGRISISSIDKKYGTKLELFVKNPANFKKDSGKTAKIKYDSIGLSNFLKEDFFEDDVLLEERMKAKNSVDPRHYVKFGGDKKGVLVLTGQPSARKEAEGTKSTGKFYEFVFFDEGNTPIVLPDKLVQAFKTVHKSSPDYTDFWGPKLNKGYKIPVFFITETRKENGKEQKVIHSIGLSYLYKYPYAKTVLEAVPQNLKDNKERLDLAECIFGYTRKDQSLKGRVQFSAGFSENAELDESRKLILGSPKASYYPIYIRQSGKNGKTDSLKTYNNGTIAGWKKYVLRDETWQHCENNKNLDTEIFPLKKGAVFACKVRYHNLKKVELGSLLSALTFHNTKGCFHQIGQAKPYGFGKVRVELELNEDQIQLLKLFEDTVRKDINLEWRNTPQIQELFTLASKQVRTNDERFSYMKMSLQGENEFVSAKKENSFLRSFSDLVGQTVTPVSDLPTLEQQLENDYAALLDDARSLRDIGKLDDAVKKIKEAELLFSNKLEHDTLLSEINSIKEKRFKEAEEERLRKEQEERDRAKVEGGLSFLEDINLKNEYKIFDFKGANGRIIQWMKKANLEAPLPMEQILILKTTVYRLRRNPDKKEKKSWDDFSSFIWDRIQLYVGSEIAKQWFEDK
jgi:CRISPR-associated protein (TIGR03986 family)